MKDVLFPKILAGIRAGGLDDRKHFDMQKYIDIPRIGEVLLEEFIEPLGLSQNALAKALGVPQNRISDIINGKARYNRRHRFKAY